MLLFIQEKKKKNPIKYPFFICLWVGLINNGSFVIDLREKYFSPLKKNIIFQVLIYDGWYIPARMIGTIFLQWFSSYDFSDWAEFESPFLAYMLVFWTFQGGSACLYLKKKILCSKTDIFQDLINIYFYVDIIINIVSSHHCSVS